MYIVLREHGLTLTEWNELHPADQRFLKAGVREYSERTAPD